MQNEGQFVLVRTIIYQYYVCITYADTKRSVVGTPNSHSTTNDNDMFGAFGPRGWLVLNKCRYIQYAIQLVDEDDDKLESKRRTWIRTQKDKGGEDKDPAAKTKLEEENTIWTQKGAVCLTTISARDKDSSLPGEKTKQRQGKARHNKAEDVRQGDVKGSRTWDVHCGWIRAAEVRMGCNRCHLRLQLLIQPMSQKARSFLIHVWPFI